MNLHPTPVRLMGPRETAVRAMAEKLSGKIAELLRDAKHEGTEELESIRLRNKAHDLEVVRINMLVKAEDIGQREDSCRNS